MIIEVKYKTKCESSKFVIQQRIFGIIFKKKILERGAKRTLLIKHALVISETAYVNE